LKTYLLPLLLYTVDIYKITRPFPVFLLVSQLTQTLITQSEHIEQWATPHHLSDVHRGGHLGFVTTWHDRRLGGIGRLVPIAH